MMSAKKPGPLGERLRSRNRALLPAAGDPPSTELAVGKDRYVVLSYPLEADTPAALAKAEKAVFNAILSGHTNQQIATARGRSVRTVANQVAAILQKLGVRSRYELITKFSGTRSKCAKAAEANG